MPDNTEWEVTGFLKKGFLEAYGMTQNYRLFADKNGFRAVPQKKKIKGKIDADSNRKRP